MIDDTVEPGRPLGGAAEDVPVPVVLAAELVEDDVVSPSELEHVAGVRAYFPRRIFGVCCLPGRASWAYPGQPSGSSSRNWTDNKEKVKEKKSGGTEIAYQSAHCGENGLESVGAGAFDYADEYAGVEDNLLDDHLRSGSSIR